MKTRFVLENFSASLEIIFATNDEIAATLQNILLKSQISNLKSQFTTKLDFPPKLGSRFFFHFNQFTGKQYANVDPYELLAKHSAAKRIWYCLRHQKGCNLLTTNTTHCSRLTNATDFNPTFKELFYFVHLGKKQNSREGIQHYRNLSIDKSDYIEQIWTHAKIIHANELDEFCYYMEVHENIVANVLNLRKLKDLYFPDFPGTIKSLGARAAILCWWPAMNHRKWLALIFSKRIFCYSFL